MTKLRTFVVAVLLAAGCTPPPAPADPTPAEKAAAPKGSCFCKANACLCSHCSTGKGDCNCRR